MCAMRAVWRACAFPDVPFTSDGTDLTLQQYQLVHKEKTLLSSITSLKLALSDQNLELLPDYEQRIGVLKELKFIDENQTVQLKGRVACEVLFST